MKGKFLFFLWMVCTITTANFAQSNYYYYYKGKKVYLNLDKSSLYIHTDSTFLKTSIADPDIMDYTLKTESNTTSNEVNKWSIIDFETLPSDLEYYQKINSIKSVNTINVVAPSFTTMSGKKVVLSRHFYVKLNQPSDLSLLQQQAAQHNVLIKNQNQFMPLWYTLVCTENTIENSLEVANAIFETGLFASSSPNFMSIREEEQISSSQIPTNTPFGNCPNVNDQLFGLQWNLENTGQRVSADPLVFATEGIDINACEAWNITTGNSDIKIAVIDHGIELDHPDLIANIDSSSYDTLTFGTSAETPYSPHGTQCAGIIGAVQNNTIGVSGIAPNCKLMSISSPLDSSIDDEPLIHLADGINFAVNHGADVINNSWNVFNQHDAIDAAYDNAHNNGRSGKGCVVVFSSGNSEGTITNYPANNNDSFIVVGAMSPCGERANSISCDGLTGWGSAFGQKLDVVAPGVYIPTTEFSGDDGFNPGDYYLDFLGTSAAAPHVAAVAGLILSVNPCLTNIDVNNIIESTAQKVGGYNYQTHSNRPNGTWNEEMGYGLVDAHAAVLLAQSMNSSTVDLYTKNSPLDFGAEPDTTSPYPFVSEDIWVRTTNDGTTNQTHQTPNPAENPNYAYVRVTNRSCSTASLGSEKLNLYWSKSPSLWPTSWDGSHVVTVYPSSGSEQLVMGNHINEQNIPVLQPGESAILEFEWQVPFPEDYYLINPFSYWSFSLLSRIVASNDPMTVTETSSTYNNTLNNNNIAWKNINVISNGILQTSKMSSSVVLSNPFQETKAFRLEFITDTNEYGKSIYEEAEITLTLDDNTFNAWNDNGKQGVNFLETNNEKTIIASNNNLMLDNVILAPNELYSLSLTFHFLTKELTNKSNYNYYLLQYDAETNELICGNQFIINKEDRTPFLADAGNDLEIDKNETITLSAAQINEAAVYNWYDPEGNLIYTGKDLTVSADVTKQYKLEIVADADGFKDYDEVDVTVNQFYLNTIVPNPATNNVTINYKTIDIASAYLMIIGTNNNTSNNYIINTNLEQTTLDISNYPIGYYTIALVCNGDIVDAKTLIKN